MAYYLVDPSCLTNGHAVKLSYEYLSIPKKLMLLVALIPAVFLHCV